MALTLTEQRTGIVRNAAGRSMVGQIKRKSPVVVARPQDIPFTEQDRPANVPATSTCALCRRKLATKCILHNKPVLDSHGCISFNPRKALGSE